MSNDKNEDLISLEGLEAYIAARRGKENTEIRFGGTGTDIFCALAAIINDFTVALTREGIPDEWISLNLGQTVEAAVREGLKRAKEEQHD